MISSPQRLRRDRFVRSSRAKAKARPSHELRDAAHHLMEPMSTVPTRTSRVMTSSFMRFSSCPFAISRLDYARDRPFTPLSPSYLHLRHPLTHKPPIMPLVFGSPVQTPLDILSALPKTSTHYLILVASHEERGRPWCRDCEAAEPLIAANIAEKESTVVWVGSREE